MLITLIDSVHAIPFRDYTWGKVASILANIVKEHKDDNHFITNVIAHIMIAMICSKKVPEASEDEYIYVIKEYINQLKQISPMYQIFYANFLIKDDIIIDVMSDQLLGIDDKIKNETMKNLDMYLPRVKEEIINAIWEKSFAVENDDKLLINSIQWYFIDVLFYLKNRIQCQ